VEVKSDPNKGHSGEILLLGDMTADPDLLHWISLGEVGGYGYRDNVDMELVDVDGTTYTRLTSSRSVLCQTPGSTGSTAWSGAEDTDVWHDPGNWLGQDGQTGCPQTPDLTVIGTPEEIERWGPAGSLSPVLTCDQAGTGGWLVIGMYVPDQYPGAWGPEGSVATGPDDPNSHAYLTIEDGGKLATTWGMVFGHNGWGIPDRFRHGELTMNGGELTVNGEIRFGGWSGGSDGTINMNGGTLTANGPTYLGGYHWTHNYILQTGGLMDMSYVAVGCGAHNATTIDVSGGTFMADNLSMHEAINHGWTDGQVEIRSEPTQGDSGEVLLLGDKTADADLLHLISIGEVSGYGVANNIAMELVDVEGTTYTRLTSGHYPYVKVDIKPDDCPNPMVLKGEGTIKATIIGEADFDVRDIDAASVTLGGAPALRSKYEDVTNPVEGCDDCTAERGPDGIDDLVLKFDKADVVPAIGSVSHGDVVELLIEGEMNGFAIVGSDCVTIVGKADPAQRPPKK
jgi:hypothetical protein